MEKLIEQLKKWDACAEGIKHAEKYTSFKTLWSECERGDWMLWLIGKLAKGNLTLRKRLVLVACKCARLSLTSLPDGEDRPLKAVETAEQWARGEDGVSLEDVSKASAYAVRADAYAAYAAYAARAATYAATYADATYAADAIYATYAARADKKARAEALAQCTEFAREEFGWEEIYELIINENE